LANTARVTVDVYNILGQRVDVLYEGTRPAGEYSLTWDASSLSSGMYFIRLATDDFTDVKSAILLK